MRVRVVHALGAEPADTALRRGKHVIRVVGAVPAFDKKRAAEVLREGTGSCLGIGFGCDLDGIASARDIALARGIAPVIGKSAAPRAVPAFKWAALLGNAVGKPAAPAPDEP